MLFEPKHSRHALGMCQQIVAQLKPGERLRITRTTLRDIEPYWHNGAQFTAPDRVLGGIMGSGYSLWYEVDPMSQDVIIGRIVPLTDGRRTYVDPDYRHAYMRDGMFWRPRPEPAKEAS